VLGLDPEFSFPALMDFLQKFKQLCDSIETFGPPIQFVYKPTGKTKSVKFQIDDNDVDTVSSLSHMSSTALSVSRVSEPRLR
jgi:hypothetical protein